MAKLHRVIIIGMRLCLLPIAIAQLKPYLELKNNTTLIYKSSGGQLLIKALQRDQSFQGFGVVNRNEIFLAYSSSGAEASSILSVYEIDKKIEKTIIEIGGTGESDYSLNENTGIIAFNWIKGIYVFPLTVVRKLPSDFEKTIQLVRKCSNCYKPQWIARDKIKYIDEFGKFKEINVELPIKER